jgi:hypothetical protein
LAWTEVNNKMYQFDPSLSTTQVFQVGTNGVPLSGARGRNLNISPRIGFSARIFSKTSFHGGFGLYYEAPDISDTTGLSINAPGIDYWVFNNTNGYEASGFNWVSNGFVHTRATSNAPAGAPLYAQDPNAKTPYAEQWHASVVSQADRLLFRAALARVTFSRISVALAVQMKGLGF